MLQAVEHIVLASASPRRKDFLENLGLEMTVCPAEVDETPLPTEDPNAYVSRVTLMKAETVSTLYPAAWILAADTIVTLGDEVLGKPGSPEEAVVMLMRLSGRQHVVQTAYCLMNKASGISVLDSRVTAVRFSPFGQEVAAAYVRSGEPMDKAGSYGIQGRGGLLVAAIDGSYSNVVGLPLSEVIDLLKENAVITVC